MKNTKRQRPRIHVATTPNPEVILGELRALRHQLAKQNKRDGVAFRELPKEEQLRMRFRLAAQAG